MAEEVKLPPLEWRCFHCDEVFTDRAAALDHFGMSECETPACKVDPNLAAVLRIQQEELRKYRQEETELGLLYYKFGSDHCIALRKEEQKGYDRGLADGQALMSDTAAIRKGARMGVEAAAAVCDPSDARKCGCIERLETGTYYQSCDCQNGGDLADAQSWVEATNLAQAIRAIDTDKLVEG